MSSVTTAVSAAPTINMAATGANIKFLLKARGLKVADVQNSHASVNGYDLHYRAVVDALACVCPPEEITVGRAVVAVLRLVPRPEQSAENAHEHHTLFG